MAARRTLANSVFTRRRRRRRSCDRLQITRFFECPNGDQEVGFQKIAIYGSGFMYTHVARQLPDGKWTSKLGQLEDITHSTPEALAGSDCGDVVQFMKRPMDFEQIVRIPSQ